MKYLEFFMKSLCMIAIIAVLLQYQQIAEARAALVEARESEIAEVEDYNRRILAEQEEMEKSPWMDGTFEGTGEGFGGDIVVSVTISDGIIASVEITSADGEDDAYFSQAVTLTDDILKAQSADVDSVSGATFSSEGIKAAVEDALRKAEKA